MGRGLALMLVAMVALSGSACEALVPTDLPPFTCKGEDPATCPPGSFCDGTHCVPCDGVHCSADGGGVGADGGVDIDGGGDATSQSDAAFDGAPLDASGVDAGGDGAACGGQLGCACATGADCASHVCGDASVLSSAFTSAAGSVCTTPCCTSGDCPAGFVCYGAGTGGSYCVRATTLARPAVAAGAGPGGACNVAGDCRSGVCTAGHCVDTCCSDASCAAPTVCSLTPGIDQHTSFVCVVHPGFAARTDCTTGAACASDVCAFGTCRPHCCGHASAVASGYHECVLDVVSTNAFAIADYPSMAPTGVDFGGACTQDSECKSRLCDLTTRTCSDVCCVDSDCSAYGAFVCRPAQRGPGSLTTEHLLCVGGP